MVHFPESAVLYLRHDRKTPDLFTVIIQTPNGNISYDIPIVKVQQGKITEYIKKTICEMFQRVLKKIAIKYDRVREVVSVMGGKILEYEAKDILRVGRKEGRKEGILQTLCDLVRDGLLAVEEAARRADMTVEEFGKVLSKNHESV